MFDSTSEVDEVFPVDQQVRGLDVAVHQPGFVRGVQCGGGLGDGGCQMVCVGLGIGRISGRDIRQGLGREAG